MLAQSWALRGRRVDLLATSGDKIIADIAVKQVVGGMRGIPALVCDTSVVDPDKGLIIRGTPVAHLADKRPEEIFFLLLTGELPDAGELEAVQNDLAGRIGAPSHVWDVLEKMPDDSHPMAMLSTALLAMESQSVFRERYEAGMKREEQWEAAL